jgi:PAS domain S-box-containing protein
MSSINEPEIWRGILESLPIGLCVLDLQKKIVLWSNGAERITGHLRHEVAGRSCVSEPILHCDQPGCEFCSEECPLAQAMKAAHQIERKVLLHHKAGYEIPVRARAVPVHNEHGSIIGSVETFEENKEVNKPEAREPISRSEIDPVTSAARREILESRLASSSEISGGTDSVWSAGVED